MTLSLTHPVAILFLTQGLFICADLLAKTALAANGFTPALATNPHFVAGMMLRMLALMGQFWLMAQQPLGKVMTLMFVGGIILTNLLGWAMFGEVLGWREYVGVALALAALLALVL